MDIMKIKEKQEDKNKKINCGEKISAPEVWRPQKAENLRLRPRLRRGSERGASADRLSGTRHSARMHFHG